MCSTECKTAKKIPLSTSLEKYLSGQSQSYEMSNHNKVTKRKQNKQENQGIW